MARFAERFAELRRTALAALTERDMLLHGDIRADNMFFPGDELKVVDFQFAARGCGAADIAYLVSQGLPTEVRRGHDEALVREYLDHLAAHGVTDYAFDEAWRHYRFAVGLPDGAARHHAHGWDACPSVRARCASHSPTGGGAIDEIDALEVFAMTRTAREVVELYNLVVWNERDFALAEELMGDTVTRHDVGSRRCSPTSRRWRASWTTGTMFETIRFDLNLVVAGDDGEHVAIVYQSPMKLKDGTEDDVGSMEIFRVVDGRITEVWNCGYKQGVWAVTDTVLDELGYYLLAGAGGEGPAGLMDEARRGEELGFGTAFISERWNVKEASSLTGAACAVTSRMQIATAATNHNTRHPLITGSWATTMHRLSEGALHPRDRPRDRGDVRRLRRARR